MPRTAMNPGSRPRQPRSAVVELAMEFQLSLDKLRAATHPLFEAALRTGDGAVIGEAQALSRTLKSAHLQIRRLTGLADGLITCADGLFEPGHGAAA